MRIKDKGVIGWETKNERIGLMVKIYAAIQTKYLRSTIFVKCFKQPTTISDDVVILEKFSQSELGDIEL